MIKEEQTYRVVTERQLVGEEVDLLNKLYGLIWMEALYDFDTPETQAYAKKLLPTIKRLNELLGFSK